MVGRKGRVMIKISLGALLALFHKTRIFSKDENKALYDKQYEWRLCCVMLCGVAPMMLRDDDDARMVR